MRNPASNIHDTKRQFLPVRNSAVAHTFAHNLHSAGVRKPCIIVYLKKPRYRSRKRGFKGKAEKRLQRKQSKPHNFTGYTTIINYVSIIVIIWL